METGDAFNPREAGFDFIEHVRRAIAWSPFEHRITVRLQGRADELAESVPAWCGVLVAENDESALLHIGADSADALLATLCILRCPFEVVESGGELADLRSCLARVGEALNTHAERHETAAV